MIDIFATLTDEDLKTIFSDPLIDSCKKEPLRIIFSIKGIKTSITLKVGKKLNNEIYAITPDFYIEDPDFKLDLKTSYNSSITEIEYELTKIVNQYIMKYKDLQSKGLQPDESWLR